MYPTDAPGSVSGLFTDGNATLGQEGTVVDAAFMNEIQGELLAVLAQGGITPSKGTRTQVRDAILAMIADAFSPIGEPRVHWGPVETLAANELPLDGRKLLRSSYPTLYGLYGNVFKTDAGPTEFNIPDFRDTYLVGAGGALQYAARAGANTVTPSMQTAGAHDHGGQTAGHALTVDQIPAHEHTVVADRYVANDDATGVTVSDGGVLMANRFILDQANTQTNFRAASTGGGQTHAHAVSSGGGHTHNVNPVDNRPQSIAMVWKIRAL